MRVLARKAPGGDVYSRYVSLSGTRRSGFRTYLKGELPMAELTRREMVAGGAVAAAAGAGAAIAAKPAFAANERVDGPGFNAGWGDTELTDPAILDTPFGQVVDDWFQYTWSYSAEFEPQPERDHVLVIVSSGAVGGNGDHIAEVVVDEIGDAADVETIYLRDLQINQLMTWGDVLPVMQEEGNKDGMVQLIEALHRSNVVVAIAPTYYNNPDARLMLAITRLWSMCWKNPNYVWGPTKRVAVMLTCTGTKADYLKIVCRGIFSMADMSILTPEWKAEVFNGCGAPTSFENNDEYIETARSMARWAIHAE